MRRSLMKTLDEIRIMDLHGNAKKKEACPDGSTDENVFDIQQGVAICLMIKLNSGDTIRNCRGSFDGGKGETLNSPQGEGIVLAGTPRSRRCRN